MVFRSPFVVDSHRLAVRDLKNCVAVAVVRKSFNPLSLDDKGLIRAAPLVIAGVVRQANDFGKIVVHLKSSFN